MKEKKKERKGFITILFSMPRFHLHLALEVYDHCHKHQHCHHPNHPRKHFDLFCVVDNHHSQQMDDINKFLTYKSVPKKLRQKVNNYYQYIWDNRMGQGDNGMLSNLPRSLKTEILLDINRHLIEQVPFFKKTNKEFIKDIIEHLQPIVFLPNDFIFKKGDVGTCMFFISTGSVDVLLECESKKLAILNEGDYFGEMALIKKCSRTRSVIANDYCKVYVLEKNIFDSLLQKYPSFKKHIFETIKMRQSTD